MGLERFSVVREPFISLPFSIQWTAPHTCDYRFRTGENLMCKINGKRCIYNSVEDLEGECQKLEEKVRRRKLTNFERGEIVRLGYLEHTPIKTVI
jgi:hypothetical protein